MGSCAVLYLPWGILEISQASDAIVTGLLFVCLPPRRQAQESHCCG